MVLLPTFHHQPTIRNGNATAVHASIGLLLQNTAPPSKSLFAITNDIVDCFGKSNGQTSPVYSLYTANVPQLSRCNLFRLLQELTTNAN